MRGRKGGGKEREGERGRERWWEKEKELGSRQRDGDSL